MINEVNTMRTSIASPLFDLESQGYFTSAAGYTHARYVPFTDAAKHIYAQIFAILDYFELEYFVFAGSLVGYVRNGRMPPWMDDIDIMIFEKNIPFYEETVAPKLRDLGFEGGPTGKKHAGGGYHILSLKQGRLRSEGIPFSDTQDISVPWAQFDVFFSEVDENQFVRNKSGWGIYHRKNVPIDWVKPPRTVEMDGMVFTTLANIEADVLKEYGDVRKELVVRTHGTTFLSAARLDWELMHEEFTRIVRNTVSPLTPGLSVEAYRSYKPVPGVVCEPPIESSFDDIMKQIVEINASEVKLKGDNEIFWVMDIKRLAPHICLSVHMNSEIAVKRAAHLRQFIDTVTASHPKLLRKHEDIVKSMTAIVGDREFPGNRKVEDVL